MLVRGACGVERAVSGLDIWAQAESCPGRLAMGPTGQSSSHKSAGGGDGLRHLKRLGFAQ